MSNELKANCKLGLQFEKGLDRETCKQYCCCKMPNGEGKNLKELVELYNEERLVGFLTCLQQKEDLADCVTGCLSHGNLATIKNAFFHSHVRTYNSHREAVLKVAKKLKEKDVLLDGIQTFEDLIDRINALFGHAAKMNHVKYYGPLYIYDTAIRIGYHLIAQDGSPARIMPEEYVYLQAGALTGTTNLQKSRAIDLGPGYPKKIQTDVLLDAVPELKGLKEEKGVYTKALLIEDFFCVFEDYLEEAAKK
jgi:hypothetical protein